MIVIMSDDVVEWLWEMPGVERELDPNQFLFHRGDAVRHMHVVRDGEVRLVRYLEDGAALVLQRARAGSIVAEASLFAAVYHCDGSAYVPTRMKSIPKETVTERLWKSHSLSEAFAAHLAREVQQARMRSEILMFKTVKQRLVAWLATRGGTLPARGNWRSVAMEIGVSPEALYRELAKRRR
jgi:CRP-like cAMP-binding protein